MKINLTIQLLALLVLLWGEWQFWNSTSNRRTIGDYEHYNYNPINKSIRTNTRFLAMSMSAIGVLILIWSN